MNKYKEAFNTICDILGYYMVHMDESLLPSDNEIYDAMAVLRKLVDNTNSSDEAPVSEKLPKKSMNQLYLQKQLLIAMRLKYVERL